MPLANLQHRLEGTLQNFCGVWKVIGKCRRLSVTRWHAINFRAFLGARASKYAKVLSNF